MKHSLKIIIILLIMFFLTQLIGIAVVKTYSPEVKQITTPQGSMNITTYNLPYGLDPPQDTQPTTTLISIIIAIAIAVILMLLLMKFQAEVFLKVWFFIVIVIALSITLNSAILGLNYSPLIALAFALPLAFLKIFKRNIIIHNLTELLVYPGIAAIFVPLFSIWTVVLLLILISIYDIYAVWHAGFMQKMAQYQIKKLKLFSGFFVPYLGKKQKMLIKQTPKNKLKSKKVKVNVAILGGGDVVFPIILAGVVLNSLGLMQAIIISIGATLALTMLFIYSQKGKFYPAMPFISAGCFIALAITHII